MIPSLIIKVIFKRVFFISNFFFFYLLIFPCFLIAQDSDPTSISSDLKDEQPGNLEKIDNEDYGSSKVGSLYKIVSFGVLGAANRADTFFDDNRSITDTNKTWIRFRVDTYFGNISKIKLF